MTVLLEDERSWRMNAACRGEDPTLFHPNDGQRGPKTYEPAKRICRRCPVRRPCLEFALKLARSIQSDHGCFGGTSPDEREEIRRCRSGTCEHGSHGRPR